MIESRVEQYILRIEPEFYLRNKIVLLKGYNTNIKLLATRQLLVKQFIKETNKLNSCFTCNFLDLLGKLKIMYCSRI